MILFHNSFQLDVTALITKYLINEYCCSTNCKPTGPKEPTYTTLIYELTNVYCNSNSILKEIKLIRPYLFTKKIPYIVSKHNYIALLFNIVFMLGCFPNVTTNKELFVRLHGQYYQNSIVFHYYIILWRLEKLILHFT